MRDHEDGSEESITYAVVHLLEPHDHPEVLMRATRDRKASPAMNAKTKDDSGKESEPLTIFDEAPKNKPAPLPQSERHQYP
jgi:hypothetical protein